MKKIISIICLATIFITMIIVSVSSVGAASLTTPNVTKLENTSLGIKLTWDKVVGAEKYRVFVKNGSTWKGLGNTKETYYTDTSVKSGSIYTYTVRCISADGKTYTSAYNTTGWTQTYCSVPNVTKIENVSNGIKLTWNKVNGAESYRVFYKSGSTWKGITNTVDTTFTDTSVVSGTSYTYTVRCISSDGKLYTSGYNSTGWSQTFCSVPKITKIEDTSSGIKLTWGKVTGAVNYRVFVKNGSTWKGLANTTSNTYTHSEVSKGNTYTYTVRCVSSDGKSFTSAYNTTGWSKTYSIAISNLNLVVGQQIDLANLLSADFSGKKVTYSSDNSSVIYVNSSGLATAIAENKSTSINATASNGTTMTFKIKVKSFTEAVKGVDVKISGRDSNTSSFNSNAYTSVCLYKAVADTSGTGYGIIPNGTVLNIEDVSYTGNPSTSRFKVTYKGNTGWVKLNYCLINLEQFTPSYNIAMSFSSNSPYVTKYGSATPNDSDKYNMFNYKSSKNVVTGLADTKYYSANIAWLRYDVAIKLAQAQAQFLKDGYCIKIYDAYRPYSVTNKIDESWDSYIAKNKLTEKSSYGSPLKYQIANKSVHNWGGAVDLTLTKNGKEVIMPTNMHDLSWNAEYAKWVNSTSTGASNAKYLRKVMGENGLSPYAGEWWHFQDDSVLDFNKVYYACGV